jgi:16S rRNA (cytosine1402-N4)-methyltransferase
MELGHLPVMPVEVLGTLVPAPGSLQIDATVGGGGHTERILEAANPDGRVLGLDADQAAIDRVAQRLAGYGDRLVCAVANFRELAAVAPAAGFDAVDGALFDLGLSSFSSRIASGASASAPAARSTCASTRRAACRPRSCSRPSTPTSSPPCSAATARSRPRGRSPRRRGGAETAPIETAEDLAQLIETVSPGNPRQRRASTRPPACSRRCGSRSTRADALPEGLASAVDLLRPGGRLVVLSYHSLEDRIVKRFFAAERRGCTARPRCPCICGHAPRLRLVTRPSMTPTQAEVDANPEPERAPALPSGWPPERAAPSTDEEPTPSRADRSLPTRRSTSARCRPRLRRRSPVSKRHQQNRRKSYGRRQHELHERLQRDRSSRRPSTASTTSRPVRWAIASFMDTRTSRFRYALGD